MIHHKNYTYKLLEEILALIPIGLYFRQGSPFVETFNEKLRLLQSAGLIGYWTDEYIPRKFAKVILEENGPKQMTIETLLGAFQILILGYLFSVVVFLVEKASFKLSWIQKVCRLKQIVRILLDNSSILPWIALLIMKKMLHSTSKLIKILKRSK